MCDASTASMTEVFYSRRTSGLDDTARALPPERECSSRQHVSDRLQFANLQFSCLNVIGRDSEIEALYLAYGRARGGRVAGEAEKLEESAQCNTITFDGRVNGNSDSSKLLPASQKELVLISGISGCGKTRLASTLADRYIYNSGGLFVQGKYDLYFRDEPYFGIGQACSEIVGHILQLKSGGGNHTRTKFGILCDQMKEEIGDELYLLANVVPSIAEVVGDECAESRENAKKKGGDVSLERSKEQFNYMFKKFIQIVTADQTVFGGPLVMVLDDLQWADTASLELLELLLTDRESSGLMIIGCYRSEEASDSDGLIDTICELNNKAETKAFNITELALEQLTSNDVNVILMELLSVDDGDKTLPLAELCHKRSMGNPFHLLTFLRMLQDERFLEFNLGLFCWTFDVDTIEKKTSATSNVVDMVTKRLEQAQVPLLEVLHIAACLGSSFEFEILYLVWNEMRQVEETTSQLDIYLEEAVEWSILEANGDSMKYRWTHDRVQESAMVLGDRASGDIRVDVGLVLLRNYNIMDESIVFVIANLLQCDSVYNLGKGERDDIAQINLKAAQKAVACSAFKSAAKYVRNGVALLPADAFLENYDLALELFSLGAEVEGSVGSDVKMRYYYDKVISHATDPLHKVRSYNVKLSQLCTTNRSPTACRLCIDILNELGTCKIPSNSMVQKVKALMALQKIKDISEERLHGLPLMTDQTQLATMKILNSLTTAANISGDDFLRILAPCTMYQCTLKYGLCHLTASVFAHLAIVRCVMGNCQGSQDFCNHALSLIPLFDSKADLSQTYFISYYLIKPWIKPFSSCLKYLQESYKAGMESGDTQSGCLGIMMYLVLRIRCGTNLDSITADMKRYRDQILDFGFDGQALYLQIYMQSLLCLMGFSRDSPTEMSGEIIPDASEFEQELHTLESKMPPLLIYQSQQSFLYCIFREHEKGAKLAIKRGDAYHRVLASDPAVIPDVFHKGISVFEMARRTRKRIYKRAAKKILATMRKWAKSGNPNVVHIRSILEAEQFALNGDEEKATLTYGKSIILSVRQGVLQDAALASERYGEYLLNELNDEGMATYFFGKAISYYKDWGAHAKVAQMNAMYSHIWSIPNSKLAA